MEFTPNYRYFEDVMYNRLPARLPIYEHLVSPAVMEQVLETSFASVFTGNERDLAEYFTRYCGFSRKMTYDVVSLALCLPPAQSILRRLHSHSCYTRPGASLLLSSNR